METPSSSIRRVTRSQTLVSANSANNSNISISRKVEECDNNGLSKSWQRNRMSQDSAAAKGQDRSALFDITNDSPIGGLAAGHMITPISSVAKQGSCWPKMMTPGSGEALLRGQVKTLLQKVEEEAEISKISLGSRPFVHLQSPAGLLAPTPANTPEILNLSQDGSIMGVTNVPIVAEQLISQVVNDVDGKKQEESQITRSLLLDFSEKSDTTDEETESSVCSSVFTSQEKSSPSQDDENSSLCSIQVNASSHYEDEEEDGDEEKEDMEGDDEVLVDELCRGLSKISVNEEGKAEEFVGKHTRFVYDSDDELIEEVSDKVSPNVLRLKGMPTPKGKHLRFSAEDEEVEVEASS